jgi:hypothetical protein
MVSRRRPSPSSLDEREASLAHARARLRAAEEVASLKGHPGWQAIQAMVRGKVEAAERYLDNFEGLTPEQRLLVLKERADMRFFLNIVETFESGLPELHKSLAQAQQNIDEARGRLGSASS